MSRQQSPTLRWGIGLGIVGLLMLVGCASGPTVRTSADNPVRVVRVTDGDTFIARIGDRDVRVRVVGIDTPEVAQSDAPAECYGPEATQRTRQLLDGKTVTLERDSLQSDRDVYGRLLRHVRLNDQRLLGEALIVEGFARVYTGGPGHDRLAAYRMAERQARADGVGMWGACRAR